MSDVFISYASANSDRAEAVADILAEQGWSVVKVAAGSHG